MAEEPCGAKSSAKDFENCPRFDKHELSEDQIIEIAAKAVQFARNEFYKEVGQTVVSKLLWVIGVVAVSLYMWLTDTHHLFNK
jgi:hypothetical protein